ncbi:MAG: hypothetical protein ACXVAU_17220 [Mucilaginibacter sp.]
MKRIALIVIIALLSCSLCRAQQPDPKVWTAAYEKAIYDEMYKSGTAIMKDEKQKVQFIDCFIDKIKHKLPKGFDSVPIDSVKAISADVARSCFKEIQDAHIFLTWSPENEKSFRTGFLNKITRIDPSMRNRLCDCVIAELKIKYPDGFTTPIDEKVEDTVTNICVEKELKLKKAKQDTTHESGAN